MASSLSGHTCQSFVKMVNGTGETMAYQPKNSRVQYRNIWFNYRIDVIGNTFTVYRDGIVFNNFTDTEGTLGFGPTTGTIGFWTAYNGYTYFERLRVCVCALCPRVPLALCRAGRLAPRVFVFSRLDLSWMRTSHHCSRWSARLPWRVCFVGSPSYLCCA
jgi:hypothetical protein